MTIQTIALFVILLPFTARGQAPMETEEKAQASAVTVEESAPFASLCITEQSTGFNWSNGDWKKTTHHDRTFVLKKVPMPVENEASSYAERWRCLAGDYEPIGYERDLPSPHKICISKKEFRSKDPVQYFPCHEFADITAEGVYQTRIECGLRWQGFRFAFSPDGWIHFFQLSSDLGVASRYKDSMDISIGHCSRLSLELSDK